jgi:hypothetical protein
MSDATTLTTPSGANLGAALRDLILRAYYGQRGGTKMLARDTGASTRTAERYIRGERTPTTEHLLTLMQRNAQLRDQINLLLKD